MAPLKSWINRIAKTASIPPTHVFSATHDKSNTRAALRFSVGVPAEWATNNLQKEPAKVVLSTIPTEIRMAGSCDDLRAAFRPTVHR